MAKLFFKKIYFYIFIHNGFSSAHTDPPENYSLNSSVGAVLFWGPLSSAETQQCSVLSSLSLSFIHAVPQSLLILDVSCGSLKYSHFQEPQKTSDQHIIVFGVLLKTCLKTTSGTEASI